MSKTEKTKAIENILLASCFGKNPRLAERCGCEEVTIGFQRDGGGKERVDFLAYNIATDNFYCYEIKVSLSDLHSNAALSWRGNYNYLVIDEELFDTMSLNRWKTEIPINIGLVVCDLVDKTCQVVIKPHKLNVNEKTKSILKNSLIRTLFYKNNKTNEKKEV